jgi:hypothetical protein
VVPRIRIWAPTGSSPPAEQLGRNRLADHDDAVGGRVVAGREKLPAEVFQFRMSDFGVVPGRS